MPYYRGVTVQVTTGRGEPLPEYGHQQFSRMKTTSCHLEARTGVRFGIKITPHPILASRMSKITSNPVVGHSGRLRDDNHTTPVPTAKVSTIGQLTSAKPKKKVHLMARVFIDGREKSEQGCMLYLDETHPEYKRSEFLAARFVDEGDGIVGKRFWVFADIGVGAVSEMLGSLATTEKDSEAVNEQDDGEIAELNTLLGNSALNGAGKIVVEVTRVTIRDYKGDWQPRFKAGEDEKVDDNMASFGKDVTHVTRVAGHRQSRLPCPKYRLRVDSLDGKGGVYARFEFHYVSRLKLLALNMMDENGNAVKRQDWSISSNKAVAGKKRSNIETEQSNKPTRDQAA